MSVAAQVLNRNVRRALLTQALLILITAATFALIQGWRAALSAGFGGAIALVGTWWMGRRARVAGELAHSSPAYSSLTLYAGAVQRFVFALCAFALGMGVFELPPVPLLVAFAAAQFGYVLAAMERPAH